MLRGILERVILFLVPIALGYLWRMVSQSRRRSRVTPEAGRLLRPVAQTAMPLRTWLWLVAAGAALVALSLLGGVFLPHAPDRGVYMPGEVGPGGEISQGHFAPTKDRHP